MSDGIAFFKVLTSRRCLLKKSSKLNACRLRTCFHHFVIGLLSSFVILNSFFCLNLMWCFTASCFEIYHD